MFDDHCCQLTGGGTYVTPTGPSRGLVIKLNQQTHTAALVAQYGQGRNQNADYMGDVEPLQNGNVFVGWGSRPFLSEYSKAGKLLLDGYFPGSDLSYRASVEPWVGLPLTSPSGAVRRTGGRTTVYVSWNGATQVAAWRVMAGNGSGRLTFAASARKSGFETAIALHRSYATFEVQALSAAGRVLGTSKQFSARA
jgi:hypothetical protein